VKFEDAPCAVQYRLRVKPGKKYFGKAPAIKEPCDVASFILNDDGSLLLNLTQNGKSDARTVDIAEKVDSRKFATEYSRFYNGYALARIVTPSANDGSFEISVRFYEQIKASDLHGNGIACEIGIESDTRKYFGKALQRRFGDDDRAVYPALEEAFRLEHAGRTYFFATGGAALGARYLSAVEGDEEGEAQLREIAELQSKKAFCVLNGQASFVAEPTTNGLGQDAFKATRIHAVRSRPDADHAIVLIEGKLSFGDINKIKEVQASVANQLKNLHAEKDSYLRIWDEYDENSQKLLQERALSFGRPAFKKVEVRHLDAGTALLFLELPQSCARFFEEYGEGLGDTSFETCEELPSYLRDAESYQRDPESYWLVTGHVTLSDYLKTEEARRLEERARRKAAAREARRNGEKIEFEKRRTEKKDRFDFYDWDPAHNVLVLKDKTKGKNFPEEGYLMLSLIGELNQVASRMHARMRLAEGRSANLQLGVIMERNANVHAAPFEKTKGLTASIENKIFKFGATDEQRAAVDLALSTPDICLIQGPPGTGKTTVIRAICARINELYASRGNTCGVILLTAYQHDAVLNLIERGNINGIPIEKIGGKKQKGEDVNAKTMSGLESFVKDLTVTIRKLHPRVEEAKQAQLVRERFCLYRMAPAQEEEVRLAELVRNIAEKLPGGAVYAKRASALISNSSTKGESCSDMMPYIRSLRVTVKGFADDGPDRANDILERISRIPDLSRADEKLLREAADWLGSGEPPFLSNLKELKERMINMCVPPPDFATDHMNQDLVSLGDDLVRALNRYEMTPEKKRLKALAELLAELETNPYGVQDSLSEYNVAFAVTCMKSSDRLLARRKGVFGGADDLAQKELEYEYVIVDEAARVSPNDLLVPLVQGKKIILVGDHRQLPQLLDEKVMARIAKEDPDCENVTAMLKHSFFEYLFHDRLPQLGGVRCVTLKDQYRMHPALGEFVSTTFYPPEERFRSPRPASEFTQNLPHVNGKAACWINVADGRMEGSVSKYRESEADEVECLVTDWLAWQRAPARSEEEREMTIGVVAFYRGQVGLLERKCMAACGRLSERERKEMSKEQCETLIAAQRKRVTVGTVDSFQGREFDAVILSTVLTGRVAPGEALTKENALRKYRFLCMANRLNVAMSRQKRLLVLVGDAKYFDTPLARQEYAVPGIAGFLDLCKSMDNNVISGVSGSQENSRRGLDEQIRR